MILEEILPLKKQGYCCSQILMLLLLNARDEKNPGLVRSLNGLCCGMAWSGEACGILTGGVTVLSFITGKGEAQEEPHPASIAIVHEFVKWFKDETTKRYKGPRCPDIIGEGNNPVAEICGDLLSRAWDKILSLFEKYNIDPLEPR